MKNMLTETRGRLRAFAATAGQEEVKGKVLAAREAAMCIAAVSAAVMMLCETAFASSAGGQVITGVLNVVGVITRAIGVLFLIVGFVRLVIAYTQEDAPGQQRSAMFIAAGLALLLLKPILDNMDFAGWLAG